MGSDSITKLGILYLFVTFLYLQADFAPFYRLYWSQ